MRRAGLAIALAAALTLGTPAEAAVRSTVPELLQTWLEVQEDPTQWAVAWLQYEAAHSRVLDQAFYGLYRPEEKSELIAGFLHGQISELPRQMHELGRLYQSWNDDYAAVRDGFSREFGRSPQVDLYLLFAAAPQAVTFSTIDGKPALALNARLLLPYGSERLRAQLVRLLYPFLSAQRPQGLTGRSLRAVLQDEGLAALAADRLVPSAAVEELLQVSPEELGRYRAGEAAFAREMLLALDSKAPEQLERFFGAKPPAGWPPKPGRYVGLLVLRELAKTVPPKAIAAMSEQAFAEKARPILKKLAVPTP